MPMPKLNFAIVLDTIIIILLGLTQPIHINTKILQSSFLFLSLVGPKTNASQKSYEKPF
jgi:hypothetical protein